MEIKPVKKTDKPNYPIKEEITNTHLKKSMPKRWIKSTATTIAVGALISMSFAGCKGEDVLTQYTPMGTVAPPFITATPNPDKLPIPHALVAPIFEHGEGRGSLGCMMIAPPVFLSEQEALEVINEVAKEYGLTFSDKETPVFYDINQPLINPYSNDEIVAEKEIIDLDVDFVDKENGIAIELVTSDDVIGWKSVDEKSPYSYIGSTFYKTKEGAQQLQEALDESNNSFLTTGIVYDPCAQMYESIEDVINDNGRTQEEIYNQSVFWLEAQIRDFFEWLKEQGVIVCTTHYT